MQSTRTRRLPAVIAVLTGVLAALLLAAGTGALYAEHQKDDGWFTTADERFSTDTRALATESLDMDLDGFDAGLAGKARLQVTSAGGGPVFAGIAPTRDVERYLAGTEHATLTHLDTSPFRATRRPSPATARRPTRRRRTSGPRRPPARGPSRSSGTSRTATGPRSS
jgi:hypothetical protein